MIRFGSLRWAASHSVSTRNSGWANPCASLMLASTWLKYPACGRSIACPEQKEKPIVASRINRAIELPAQDQAIYYVGGHSGHVLTRAQGRADAGTWADYINIGMEHGAFDMAGLSEYMQGLVEGGPTRSGHRAPTVIVEAPVNGIDEANIRFNAWQFRQILGRGVQGILLCQAETVGAVRAFVESCRYPHHLEGTDPGLPSPLARLRGEGTAHGAAKNGLGVGTRGRGSES